MQLDPRYDNIFIPFDDYVYTDEYINGEPENGLMRKEPYELVPGGFAFICPGCTLLKEPGQDYYGFGIHNFSVFTRNGNPGAIWQCFNPDGTQITLANRHTADLNNLKFRRSMHDPGKCHCWVDSHPDGTSRIRYLHDCRHRMKAPREGAHRTGKLRPWKSYPALHRHVKYMAEQQRKREANEKYWAECERKKQEAAT